MLQVVACITQHHDLRLVALAGLICLLASYTALSLVGRAAAATPRVRLAWIIVGGIATGSGIWATHFIGMLAFQPDMPVAYDVNRTVGSIFIAVVTSGLGLGVAMGSQRGMRPLGGLLIGAGIGVMHYLGMSALHVSATLHYQAALFMASLLIGSVLSAAATSFGLARQDLLHHLGGAALLTAGICGLHFTGMAAIEILPDPSIVMGEATIEPLQLAVAITAVTFMILVLGLASSAVDQYLAIRSASEAMRLAASEERFRQLANATFEGIIIHIDGQIADANSAMCALIDRPLAWLVGRHILDVVAPTGDEGIRQQIMAGPDRIVEIELRAADGTLIPAEILAQTIDYGQGKARVVAVRDRREHRETEARMRHMADHDALTGLANRTLFYDRLGRCTALANRNGTSIAVLWLNLDRFKDVNDIVGPSAGDAILKQCADRLGRLVRDPDTLARVSGDEFAVIQIGAEHPDGAAKLAERMIQAVGEPFDLDAQEIIVGASMGIAFFPGDGQSREDLVKAAGTALHRAKAAGRGTYRFFEAEMNARLRNRHQLERDMRQAMALGQFEMHYQPLVGCKSGRTIGFEALIRWRHPERGMVSPAEFIPLAEETGLIIPLGDWILRTVCAEAASWPVDRCVAVNLSPVQFSEPNCARKILDILHASGLPPERLELEITEGVLIEDPERILEILGRLKAGGVSLSLDDFGTGYSSLSYLQRFPFDKIKIDRSFVMEMETNSGSRAIVRSVIALAGTLGMTVIAEGVETASQLTLLQNKGCDLVQGYLLGRPMPARELGKMVIDAADQCIDPRHR